MSDIDQIDADPARALYLGTAAEHIVCADVLLSGNHAFLSAQGMPYDVVADIGGRLVRIQVKATVRAKNVNKRGRNIRMAYSFSARRRGKGGSKRLGDTECDLVAFVALDIRRVAYLPIAVVGQTVQLGAPGHFGSETRIKWARTIEDFPLQKALGQVEESFAYRRQQRLECVHGHPRTPENRVIRHTSRGTSDSCRICMQKYHAALYQRKKLAAS